jgi:hypothetical protein
MPKGLIWDSINYSCSYDSVFTILYHIWNENPNYWSDVLSKYSEYSSTLCQNFYNVLNKKVSFEVVRNIVRNQLYEHNNTHFPIGDNYTYISMVLEALMGNRECAKVVWQCNVCGYVRSRPEMIIGTITNFVQQNNNPENRQTTISSLLGINTKKKKCGKCNQNGLTSFSRTAVYVSEILELMLFDCQLINLAPELELNIKFENRIYYYRLCGLIYSGQGHFVSRIIDKHGLIWFHDGIETGSICIEERMIDMLSDLTWLLIKGQKKLIYAFYKLQRIQN